MKLQKSIFLSLSPQLKIVTYIYSMINIVYIINNCMYSPIMLICFSVKMGFSEFLVGVTRLQEEKLHKLYLVVQIQSYALVSNCCLESNP